MKHYSLGLVFDKDQRNIALVTKAKPEWQKGKLNGVGGHVEEGETPLGCMKREFREETGVDIDFFGWRYIGQMGNALYTVHIYTHTLPVPFHQCKLQGLPDEPVYWYSVDDLPQNTIFNVRYLTLLARDANVHFFKLDNLE